MRISDHRSKVKDLQADVTKLQGELMESEASHDQGGRISIQSAMGLDGQDELYRNIQKYIHTLDFHHLSPDNLSKVYHAVRLLAQDVLTELSRACPHPWLSPSDRSEGCLVLHLCKHKTRGQQECQTASGSHSQWQPSSSPW
ncbi:hypothetical protein V8D89_009946 [Ganoderma adspersum]